MKNLGSKKLLKILTISCFILLLSGFVSLKSGVFDKKNTSPQYGLIIQSRDTPERGNLIMSSSKSSLAFEPDRLERIRNTHDDYIFDPGTSIGSNETVTLESKSLKKNYRKESVDIRGILSSSKSGPVFMVDHTIMSSSKSMVVVNPLFTIPDFSFSLKPDTSKDSVSSILRIK